MARECRRPRKNGGRRGHPCGNDSPVGGYHPQQATSGLRLSKKSHNGIILVSFRFVLPLNMRFLHKNKAILPVFLLWVEKILNKSTASSRLHLWLRGLEPGGGFRAAALGCLRERSPWSLSGSGGSVKD